MKQLKTELINIDKILGNIKYGIKKGEEFAKTLRRKKM